MHFKKCKIDNRKNIYGFLNLHRVRYIQRVLGRTTQIFLANFEHPEKAGRTRNGLSDSLKNFEQN